MSTATICVLLTIISVFDIRSYMKCLALGCYGSSGGKSPKRIKVKDKDLSHYPYQCTMKVDGMFCSNYVARMKNALNVMEGVWVRMDLEAGEMQVYMKQKYGDKALEDAVRVVGYTILKVNHTK